MVIFEILALLSVLLGLWQLVATWPFPLHRRTNDRSFNPGVTLLKPLKGLDDNMIDCLRSWFEQDYPGKVQLLLGVASPEDPACQAVRQLIELYPGCRAELVICPERLGVNGKVSNLIQMF